MDVDLEDKLIYGLTPMRLAYLVVSLVGAFALWSWPWMPLDAWVADITVFVVSTQRVAWNRDWVRGIYPQPTRAPSTRAPASPVAIVVTGRAPKAGASTVALEVAACLATGGDDNPIWSVTTAPAGDDCRPSASGLLLSVVAVDEGRVCYLDRGAGPCVAALIPEDEHVPRAAALNLATVVAFPDAPASRAFRELAEVVAAAR